MKLEELLQGMTGENLLEEINQLEDATYELVEWHEGAGLGYMDELDDNDSFKSMVHRFERIARHLRYIEKNVTK